MLTRPRCFHIYKKILLIFRLLAVFLVILIKEDPEEAHCSAERKSLRNRKERKSCMKTFDIYHQHRQSIIMKSKSEWKEGQGEEPMETK